MLTLSRREGETILIDHEGETLTLTITEAKPGKVKLSFRGPETFEVWREELAENPDP